MPHWHQKNTLCYNSRLNEDEFFSLICDYCEGIGTQQASIKFKEEFGRSLSRQTISKYFERISYCILEERKTYPWWSIDHWSDLTEEQLLEIRHVVYNRDQAIGAFREEYRSLIGKSVSVDNQTYIAILRDMSLKMNGLPTKNFWVHLARACELALHIEQGHDDPLKEMIGTVYDLFYSHGYFIFQRKTTPAIQRENDEWLRYKKTDEYIYSWGDFKPDPEYEKLREWWNKLTEEEKREMLRRKYLAALDGEIELPPELIKLFIN